MRRAVACCRRTTPLCAALLAAALGAGSARASDVMAGAQLYQKHCATCHGADGRPVMPGAPDLRRPEALMKADPTLLATIRVGKGAMPAYAGMLRDREILDVVAHLRMLR